MNGRICHESLSPLVIKFFFVFPCHKFCTKDANEQCKQRKDAQQQGQIFAKGTDTSLKYEFIII